MNSMRTLMLRLLTGFVAVTLIGLSAGCSADVRTDSAPGPRPTTPTGQTGAAWFDDGYLVIGSGPKIVDIYLDPLCPFCKMFEELNSPFLLDEASAENATLRIHPVAILNRLSAGTDYSTRAAAALTSVAAADPDHLPEFLQALYDNQPAEGTPGLTDEQLADLARAAGTQLGSTETLAAYQGWVDEQTERALAGPLPDSPDLRQLTVVPTILVNGRHYPGDSNEPERFQAFYMEH
jgi:protein-disulfide isomerase